MLGVRRLAVAMLLLASLVACDRFPSYQLWISNETSEAVVVVLTGHRDDHGLGLPAYEIPPNGQTYRTLPLVTEKLPDGALDAEVLLFDSECRQLEAIPVSRVGEYALTLREGSDRTLNPLDPGALPSATELEPLPGRCTER